MAKQHAKINFSISTKGLGKYVKHFVTMLAESKDIDEQFKAWQRAYKEVVGYTPIDEDVMPKILKRGNIDIRLFTGTVKITVVLDGIGDMDHNEFRMGIEWFLGPLQRYRTDVTKPIAIMYLAAKSSVKQVLVFETGYVMSEHLPGRGAVLSWDKCGMFFDSEYDVAKEFGPIYAAKMVK